jgi:hypothetical protein
VKIQKIAEKGTKMTSREAVVWALKYLIDELKSDLLEAKQVILSIAPGTGQGDDIWIRTERIHAVAEVTIAGKGQKWGDIKGNKRQNFNKKIRELKNRHKVTHRYLFVNDSIANSMPRKDEIKVVGISEAPNKAKG